jgi:hypothetical protein
MEIERTKVKLNILKEALKRILHRVKVFLFQLASPLWVRIFKYITKTGQGSDICMRHGFLPLPIHFYSPVPDLNDLQRRKIWAKKSELAGIEFAPERQIRLLRELGEKYGNECDWPALPAKTPLGFYTENNSFSFGCAAGLHSLIRLHKPKKIIEIGSGHSSLVLSSALSKNHSEGFSSEYFIVDPYPAAVTQQGLSCLMQVIPKRVELLDIQKFLQLRENDMLFVDSGHTVRTGGDVNFLFLEVFPRLAPGVIVHIHDIGLPYEYPETYFTNPSFRMFWTEAYLLQAFLSFNSQFEILLAMAYLMNDKKIEFCKAFRHYDPTKHKAISGSFWMRRTIE